ncbi:DUF3710 domain-containing protein [Phytohabitans sp. ZYX-F-186]|uniref:DUF3710 domain-containing protein n=1 Tax=Phytohabitans maris TaxID=3071409 RepID=A0ABU0ZHH8_9ACTN|nr:DUF3710 domain-containing protein [Phytohabitans sp. ZYX-F-186]MDQ7906513.1 DUF3710 domain-containing protein [Phytohabitans sp. ZYX-F-186]
MMFSRRREGGRHARDNSQRRGRAEQRYEPAEPEPVVPSVGPYDVADAPDGVQRLDLGSLKIPAVDGVEVRVQANPDGVVQQVVLVHGENALQLGVFAAPRSEGIWDEVRAEIRKSLFDDGVAAEEIDGEYGVELRARVRTPEGLTDLRFVGIDGPRWMVRGVYQGGAAVDPAGSGPLVDCLHGLVVDRGQEAKPVREPLPLRLPKELAAQAQQGQAAAEPAAQAVDAPPPVNGAGPTQPRRRPSPRPRRT